MTESRDIDLRFELSEICSLSERALSERLAWVRAEIEPHALARETVPGGLAFEFEDTPELAAKLAQLVALELECCGDVEWIVRAGHTEGRRRLEIRGIDAAVARARSSRPDSGTTADAPSKPLGRLARSAGVGTLAALGACCALPALAAVLLGSSLAAPLAVLSSPWAVAVAAPVFASVAWLWSRRRARAAADAGCGCA